MSSSGMMLWLKSSLVWHSCSSRFAAQCFPDVQDDLDNLTVKVLTGRDDALIKVIAGMAFC
jgi:hypothetical protein